MTVPSANGETTRPDRRALSLLCEARQGLEPWLRIRLIDLSECGFRVRWPSPKFNPKAPIRLRIPGLQPLTAQVRWHGTEMVGAEFAAPLHVAVFEHLVSQSATQAG